MPNVVLGDNPLLTVLGRRGRGAVIETLRADPARTWTVRELARAADVHAMTASRAVRELGALGVLDVFRPGRDAVVRWMADAAAARVLAALEVPDLRAEGLAAFAAAYPPSSGATLVAWRMPQDDPADPMAPGRVAILVRRDEDEAWDAVGHALDAVTEAGWPRPEVTVFLRPTLSDDEVGRAVRAGAAL